MNISKSIERIILSHINEAMSDSFSFEKLTSLKTYKDRINYCVNTLGNPIGNGSSRMVFQISDERVLKVAKNRKGIAQNEVEISQGKSGYSVIPEIFNYDSDNIFIETEYVLPLKKSDIQHVFGISYDEFKEFIEKCYNSYSARQFYTRMSDNRFYELLDKFENLNDIRNFMADYDLPPYDLMRLANLGFTQSNGKEWIVILDSGLTEEVFQNYYQKH